jgi:hypothetical protein
MSRHTLWIRTAYQEHWFNNPADAREGIGVKSRLRAFARVLSDSSSCFLLLFFICRVEGRLCC